MSIEVMTIKLTHTQVYGNHRYHPACDNAKLLCDWLRQKSLSKRDIDYLRRLGYKVELVLV